MKLVETKFHVDGGLFPNDQATANYCMSHDVEALIAVHWHQDHRENFHYHGSVTRTYWELHKWDVVALFVDGVHLRSNADIPSDFPMKEILRVLETEIGNELRDIGPKEHA